MRTDAQSQSLHYFNFYAVKSRVDVSNLQDEPSLPDFASFDPEQLLPTKEDHRVLLANFKIHIARVLRKYSPFFDNFACGMEKHIKQEYCKEMTQKSEVVSCGYYCYNIIRYFTPTRLNKNGYQYKI